MILDGAVASFLGQAVVGPDIFRAVNAGSINGQKKMTAQVGHFRQGLAPPQLAKNTSERPPDMGRVNVIQNGKHLGITGNDAYTVDAVQAFGLPKPPIVNASSEGSLSENMAKPLVRASSNGIETLVAR